MPDDKFGALLLIEIVDASWNASLGRLVEKFKPAGLFFRKITGPEATLEACRESARALNALPFMAIEEEGGGAFAGTFKPIPRALTLEAEGAEEAGALIGRAMMALGLNLNLAPTLDVDLPSATASASAAGERRNPGPSSAETAQRAAVFVRALESSHVLCCGRHFPGLPKPPRTDGKAIVADRSLAALWREDLVPYRTLGNHLTAIQISHAVHRAYDYEFLRPASLSPGVIEGLLRTKLGYEGVALADVPLAAQAAGISLDEAAVRALAAGCDLLLVPGDSRLLEGVCQGIERAASNGRLPLARIDQALARVKSAQRRVRQPAKQVAGREYSRLARAFEEFARKWTVAENG